MKLFKLILVVFFVMNSFVLEGCKPSVPGIYLNQKGDKLLSVELKPDGTYRIFSDKGAAVGEYVVNDNMITFIMFGKENKGEIKEESIIMENGEVWEKKKQSENTIHTYASKVDLKIRTVIASAFLWPRKGSAEVVAWGGEVECSIKLQEILF